MCLPKTESVVCEVLKEGKIKAVICFNNFVTFEKIPTSDNSKDGKPVFNWILLIGFNWILLDFITRIF